jgi:hypothetical protein
MISPLGYDIMQYGRAGTWRFHLQAKRWRQHVPLKYLYSLTKVYNVFTCLNAGIMGSNPTQGMDVYLSLFCVCVGSDPAMGWSIVQEVLPTVLGLRNWSETKCFTNALSSKVGATGKRQSKKQTKAYGITF